MQGRVIANRASADSFTGASLDLVLDPGAVRVASWT